MKTNTLFIASVFAASALAQTPALQIGAMYQCSPAQVLKVLSCKADTCEAQLYAGGQPAQRVQPPRQQLAALLAPCHVQTLQEAQAIVRAASQASKAAEWLLGHLPDEVGASIELGAGNDRRAA